MRSIIILTILVTCITSCIGKKGEVTVTRTGTAAPSADASVSASVSTVQIDPADENQLKISGTSLDVVTSVRITGPSGFDETFQIEAQSATEITISAVTGGLKIFGDALYSMIISTAQGASTVPITFTPSQSGANPGEVLKWDGTNWTPTALSGISLIGSWNANTNQTVEAAPQTLANGGVNTSPSAGNYYIVTTAGAQTVDGLSTWAIGDWIIFNGTTWDRVNNATGVTTFNGRTGGVVPATGDYTWDMISSAATKYMDYRPNNNACADGEVLKYDLGNSRWDCGVDSGAGALSSDDSVTIQADAATPGSGNILFNIGADTMVTIQNDGDIAVNGDTATTFGNDRHSVADSAGNNFTLTAGGATSGATDKDGGDLVLTSGLATGTGESKIEFKTAMAGGAGATDNNQTTKMTITGSGNVGVGTITPSAKLHVNAGTLLVDGSNSMIKVDSNRNSNSLINLNGTGNADLMHLTKNNVSTLMVGDDRNVGINTSSPSERLHVEGSIKMVDGNEGAGKVLVSDANGVGTWTTLTDNNTTYTGGDGLTLTTSDFAVNVDGTTIETSGDALRLKDDGITNAKVNSAAAIAYSKLSIADADLTIAKTSGLQAAIDGKVALAGDEMTGNLSLDNEKSVQFQEATGSGDNFVELKAPTTLAADVTLTLPDALGTNGQVLQTDASGNLSWGNKTTDTDNDTTYTGGDALVLTGTDFDVNVDNTTIEVDTDALRLKDGGVTNAKINAAAAIAYSKLSIADADLTIAKTSGLQTALNTKVNLAGDEMTGNLSLDNEKSVRFQEATGSGDNFVELKAPTTLAGDVTLTLPAALGTNGQVLQTDASGNLTWGDKTTDTDNDTTYTAGSGIDLTTGTFSIPAQGITNTMISGIAANCSNGQVLKANGSGAFTCAADAGAGGGDASSVMGETLDATLAADTTTDGQILVWSQTNTQWEVGADANTTYTGGDGLDLTGSDLSINVDDTTIETSADTLRIKDGGVTNAKINAAAAIAYSKLSIADADLTIAKTSGLQTALDGKVDLAGDTMTGHLNLDNQQELRLHETDGGGSDYVGFKAPALLVAPVIWELPIADGSNGQVLKTDGSGALAWVNLTTDTTDDLGDHEAAQNIDLNTFKLVGNNGTAGIAIDASGNVTAPAFVGDGSGLTNLPGGGDFKKDGSVHATGRLRGNFSNSFSLYNGTPLATAPTYTFEADTDSGMYRAAADTIGISTNGVERARINSSGNFGIGTTNPLDALHVSGTARFVGGDVINYRTNSGGGQFKAFLNLNTPASGSQLGSFSLGDGNAVNVELKAIATETHAIGSNYGTAFTIDTTANTSTVPAERLRVDHNGNVGIGTTAPTVPLEVSGTVKATAFVGDGSSLTGISTSTIDTAGAVNIAADNDTSGSEDMTFQTAGSTKMIIKNDGKIGIGTSSPITDFTVVGTIQGDSLRAGSLSQRPQIKSTNSAASPGYTFIGQVTTGMYNPAGSEIGFSTAGTEAMRIDSTGNVGIGTLSPNANAILDISSTTKGVLLPRMTTAQRNAITPAAGMTIFNTEMGSLQIYTGANWRDGAEAVQISDIDFDTGVYTNDTVGGDEDNVRIKTNGSERMTFLSTGNVGINDTTPSTALEVGGTVTATAFVGDGSGITGLATADDLGDHTATTNMIMGAHSINQNGDANEGISFPSTHGAVDITQNYSTNGNTVQNVLTLARTYAGGNGSTGIGAKLQFELESSSGAMRVAGGVTVQATDANSSSMDTDMKFSIAENNSSTEVMKLTGTGNLGLNDTSPDAHFEVSANGGTSDYVIFVSSDDDEDGDLLALKESGDLGLGTKTPTEKLDVVGTVKATAFVGDGSGLTGLPGGGDFKADGTVAMTGTLKALRSATTATPGLTFSGDEDTGINVRSASANNMEFVTGGSAKWYLQADGDFNSAYSRGPYLQRSASVSEPPYAFQSDLNTGIFNPAADVFGITTNGTERLRIDSAGRVGINKTSLFTTTKLDVAGSISGTSFRIPSSTLSQTNVYLKAYDDGSGNGSVYVGRGSNSYSDAPTSTALWNSGFGNETLKGVTTGNQNTATGHGALQALTNKSQNSALGYLAGGNGSPASGVFVGANSGKVSNGTANTFVGLDAGDTITTGDNNLFLGAKSGDVSTDGSSNILIGYNTQTPAASYSNHLNIGNAIYGNLLTGNIGIGDTTPSTALEVSGTVTATAFAGDGSSLTGVSASTIDTAGAVNIEADNDSSGSEDMTFQTAGTTKMIIKNDGKVGIGTTGPLAALHIQGANKDLRIESIATGAGSGPDVDFFRSNAGTTIVANGDKIMGLRGWVHDGTGYGIASSIVSTIDGAPGANDTPTRLEFSTTPDGSGTEAIRMTIKNDGKLGIGVTPSQPLHLGAGPFLIGANPSSASTSGIIVNTASSRSDLTLMHSATGQNQTADGFNIAQVFNRVEFNNRENDDMVFLTNNSEAIRIKNDGKIGIGTTSPGTQTVIAGGAFCVSSDANCDGNSDTEGQIHANEICDETGGNCIDISAGFSGGGDFMADGSVAMTGVLRHPAGTALLPSLTFGTDLNTGIYSDVADELKFTTAGTEAMQIDATGQVGIAQPNPSETLDVRGTFRVGVAIPLIINNNSTSINYSTVGGHVLIVDSNNNDNAGDDFIVKDGSGEQLLHIEQTTGYVGFGTEVPEAKLEVERAGTPTTPIAIFDDNAAANNFSDVNIEAFRPGLVLSDTTTSAEDWRIGVDNGDLRFSVDTDNDGAKDTNSSFDDLTAMTIDQTGNVAIGTTTVSDRLQVEENVNANMRAIFKNPNSGTGARSMLHVEADSAYLGLWTYSSGYANAAVADTTNIYSSGAAALNVISANSPLKFMTGADTVNPKMMINTSGNVGIGNTTPSVALDITGSIEYTGTLTDVSDRRLKTDIVKLEDGMDVINKIPTYSFVMKDTPGVTEFGVMAQEIKEVLPELISFIGESDFMGVNYMGLVPWTIKGLQEVDAKLAANTDMLNIMNGTLKVHEERISVNERKIASLEEEVRTLKKQYKEILKLLKSKK